MNRLERVELYARVEKQAERIESALAQVNAMITLVEEVRQGLADLQAKPRLGRPPKATDGNGQERPTA